LQLPYQHRKLENKNRSGGDADRKKAFRDPLDYWDVVHVCILR
jgi:hypothetical protein